MVKNTKNNKIIKEKIIGKDKIISIDKVKPNNWNPKQKIEDDTDNLKKYNEIKNEIKKKGLFEAITVRELTKDKYEIIDGYHRWRACKELGYKNIRINNLGKLDDNLAKAITLIKEQKRVELDEIKVAELIGELSKEFTNNEQLADLLGLTSEEIEEYLEIFKFDWNDFYTEIDIEEDIDNNIDIEVKEDLDELTNGITKTLKLRIRIKAEIFKKLEKKLNKVNKNKFIKYLTKYEN